MRLVRSRWLSRVLFLMIGSPRVLLWSRAAPYWRTPRRMMRRLLIVLLTSRFPVITIRWRDSTIPSPTKRRPRYNPTLLRSRWIKGRAVPLLAAALITSLFSGSRRLMPLRGLTRSSGRSVRRSNMKIPMRSVLSIRRPRLISVVLTTIILTLILSGVVWIVMIRPRTVLKLALIIWRSRRLSMWRRALL